MDIYSRAAIGQKERYIIIVLAVHCGSCIASCDLLATNVRSSITSDESCACVCVFRVCVHVCAYACTCMRMCVCDCVCARACVCPYIDISDYTTYDS